METAYVIVLTTIGSAIDGRELATVLVSERLAACVNVLPEMDSIYRWQGTVETSRERQLIIKTTGERVARLRARLHELHKYDLPEFIVVPIIDGSERYLGWLQESTA